MLVYFSLGVFWDSRNKPLVIPLKPFWRQKQKQQMQPLLPLFYPSRPPSLSWMGKRRRGEAQRRLGQRQRETFVLESNPFPRRDPRSRLEGRWVPGPGRGAASLPPSPSGRGSSRSAGLPRQEVPGGERCRSYNIPTLCTAGKRGPHRTSPVKQPA